MTETSTSRPWERVEDKRTDTKEGIKLWPPSSPDQTPSRRRQPRRREDEHQEAKPPTVAPRRAVPLQKSNDRQRPRGHFVVTATALLPQLAPNPP